MDTFEVVDRNDVRKDAKVMGGRFVLAIKNTETGRPSYKARFVVQVHVDREKEMLINTANTVRHNSVKVLVSINAMHGYRVWTQDVSQAYLLESEKMGRKAYINPQEKFKLGTGKLLRLLKPLYGITDYGDLWNNNFTKHLTLELSMVRITGDLSLYSRRV